MTRVLIVDDDEELCDLVSEYLRREGFDVSALHDGEAGAARALSGEADVVILDVMLPGLGGFEVLRRVRGASDVPILMLTASGGDADRELGLELCADDYLPKPFSPLELAARLRAILRRTQTPSRLASASHAPFDSKTPAHLLRVGDLEINSATREVRRGAEIVELTSAEFDLLAVLARAAGEIVARRDIAQSALGRSLMPYDRTIDVHISNLRRKLGPHANGRERIKTVRGAGYIYTRPNLDPT